MSDTTAKNDELIEHFMKGCKELGLVIETEQIKSLLSYKDILINANEHMNLTKITDPHEFIVKHLLDSLSCLFIDEAWHKNGLVIDVGTGAGFPGVPLGIVRTDLSLTLLDSLAKRLNFLKEAVVALKLTNIGITHNRAEDAGHRDDLRSRFDIAVSRAVARLNVLCEYCLPFLKIGGYFIAMKGPAVEEELNEGNKAALVMGGQFIRKQTFKLPFGEGDRNLVVYRKIKDTPKEFPRKAGIPERKPIT